MSTFLEPPWTDEQVAALNGHQQRRDFHPFTCGSGNRTDAAHLDGEGILVATRDGWVCPYCPYRQGWCHAFMAEPQVGGGSLAEQLNEVNVSPSQSPASADIEALKAEYRNADAKRWDAVGNCEFEEACRWRDRSHALAARLKELGVDPKEVLEPPKLDPETSGGLVPMIVAAGMAVKADQEAQRLKAENERLRKTLDESDNYAAFQRLKAEVADLKKIVLQLHDERMKDINKIHDEMGASLTESLRLLASLLERTNWVLSEEASDEVGAFLERHKEWE